MFKKLSILFLCGLTTAAFAQLDDLEDINFPLNSAIVVDGFQGLDLLASVMSKHRSLDLVVTGHTDSEGSEAYNKKLSQKRAEAVQTYLVAKGVDGGKINTNGEGIDKTHSNSSREGRFQNRRVSLTLYETVNGNRAKIAYPRMMELFFGASPKAAKAAAQNQDKLMHKLSDLEKQVAAVGEDLAKRVALLEKDKMDSSTVAKMVSGHLSMGRYNGVSISAGVDDDSDFTGQIRGLYFKPVGDNFAMQVGTDYNYFDQNTEGQLDLGLIFKGGNYQVAAAGSYKWASIDHMDTARIAQGSFLADWYFEKGQLGLFGSFPLADGDVIFQEFRGAYVFEQYISVPTQVGVDFGVQFNEKFNMTGYVSSLDADADVDLGAGLTVDMLVSDNLAAYLDLSLNDNLLTNDDNSRYMVGLKYGSWNKVQYGKVDHIKPVNIPRINYEILSRLERRGNSAPTAVAGASRTNVPAGTVTLDASASSDPEQDALTYKWSQTAGPTVALSGADSAQASFEGRQGESYTFQLTVRDDRGDTANDFVSISMEPVPEPEPEAPIVTTFIASPGSIDRGNLANLVWDTQHATEVSISGVGAVAASGNLVVSPTETTEYTLTASGPGGSVTSTATLTVVQPPDREAPSIGFFSAAPSTITAGDFSTLSWSVIDADSVIIDGLGQVQSSGSILVTPEDSITYTMTATNTAGSDSASVTITVEQPLPPNTNPVANAGRDRNVLRPGTITLDGTGSSDSDGDTLTYSWVQVSGPSVTLSGADTATPSFELVAAGNYGFRLTVSDSRGGNSSDEVLISRLGFKR